jgi:hypothetical protein
MGKMHCIRARHFERENYMQNGIRGAAEPGAYFTAGAIKPKTALREKESWN